MCLTCSPDNLKTLAACSQKPSMQILGKLQRKYKYTVCTLFSYCFYGLVAIQKQNIGFVVHALDFLELRRGIK